MTPSGPLPKKADAVVVRVALALKVVAVAEAVVTVAAMYIRSFRDRPRPKPPKTKSTISVFLCYIVQDQTLEDWLKYILTNGELIMYLKSAPLPWQSATCQKSPKTMYNTFMLKCTLILTLDIHF